MQAPAGHALMTSSRLPLSAFRCGCHLKGVEGGQRLAYQGYRLVLLWCVHGLTEGGNEKKGPPSPPARTPSPGLTEGVQMEPQIETQGVFICSLQVDGVTIFSSILGTMVRCTVRD